MSLIRSLWLRTRRSAVEDGENVRLPTTLLPSTPADIAETLDSPATLPKVFLLHDRRCPVSKRAYREVEGLGGEVYIIVVSDSPEVGTSVEELVGIPHESPQAFVIRDGAVTWHASHWGITRRSLRTALGATSAQGPTPTEGMKD